MPFHDERIHFHTVSSGHGEEAGRAIRRAEQEPAAHAVPGKRADRPPILRRGTHKNLGAIGENDGEARAAICGGLAWIGVRLDKARNRSASNPINAPASRCPVLVLASQEDEQIARHTFALFPTSLS